MKAICFALVLLSGYVDAGELLPMTGQQSRHMRQALNKTLPDAVAALPERIKVQPRLERIAIDGRVKKLLFGPLAGGGVIVLHIRFYDGDELVHRETISAKSGAWKGTFRPGTDLAMVNKVAEDAAEIVRAYSSRLTTK